MTGHDVFLAHHEEFFAIDFHFRAAVLAEQNVVAGFDVERANIAVLKDLALADSDDFALDGFSVAESGITIPPGEVRSSSRRLDDDAIVKWTNFEFLSHSSNPD